MNRVCCVSSRVSTALCWTGFANAEFIAGESEETEKLSVNAPLVSMKQC